MLIMSLGMDPRGGAIDLQWASIENLREKMHSIIQLYILAFLSFLHHDALSSFAVFVEAERPEVLGMAVEFLLSLLYLASQHTVPKDHFYQKN